MSKSSGHEKAPVLAGAEALDNVNRSRKNVMSDNSTNVVPFNFERHEVRTLLIGGEPWFVGGDVCAALDLGGRSRNFLRMLDDDEKGAHIVSTLGGAQEMQVVNESGLYALIFKSRKPEAKRFKKWVTSEVLPAIRKTGRYDDQQGRLATLIGQTIGTDGFHMLGAIVKGKVSCLPSPIQRRATSKIWSQVHAAFGVRSAADIPADQLDSARNFIAAYSVQEGDYIPKGHALPITGRSDERLLVSYDHKGNQKVDKVPANAFVLSHDDLLQGLVLDSDIPVTTEMMFEYAMAALINLRARHAFLKRGARA